MRRVVPKMIFYGVILLFVAYLGVVSWNTRKIDDDKRKERACSSHLKQIGLAIFQYREDAAGKMPPNLSALLPFIKYADILHCPALPDAVGYACVSAFPKDPGAVLCWDKEPHYHKRGLFSRMPETRDVLYTNFHVKSLKESDFQKLGLSR